jgi:fatty-acyl-CoA synthase
MQHPDCAVIGLPDDKWGERVTAVVQLRSGAVASPQELRVFARERLGGVKAPKQLEIWPDLPRSKVGKVLKVEVKAQFLLSQHQGADPGSW